MTRQRRPSISRRALVYAVTGVTQRGNPRTYWWLLECGHVNLTPHSARSSLLAFQIHVAQGGGMRYPDMRCYDCVDKRPVDIERWGPFPALQVMEQPVLAAMLRRGKHPDSSVSVEVADG